MIHPELQEIIDRHSATFGVDPRLISAIVMQETGGNPWLTRFEPNWSYWESPSTWANRLHITTQTERTLQAMSWGPMQLMGSVAREMGFQDELTRLALPELSLFYSIRHFAAVLLKYPNGHDAIAAWNAGHPIKGLTGRYANQSYVDGVLGFIVQPASIG